MIINYFYCFKEDKRTSMNMLGDFVSDGQKKFKGNIVNKVVPKTIFSDFFNKKNSIMRFERFINYPIQSYFVKKSDIAHVIDHSYAHIVNFISAKKKVITINDLIPLIFKKKLKKNFFLFKYSLSKIKYFDHVVSISEQSKKDLIKFTGIKKNKITVIYPNVENFFNKKKINKSHIHKKYKIPKNLKKIIVFDTSFYKNYNYSLRIFLKIINYNQNVILIKVGNFTKLNVDKKIENKIYNFKYLTRKQMSEIYKISDLLLFPSLYEGFGIPCIEAMKSGLPVVASGNGSLKEILHKKSIFDINNTNKVLSHINKLMTDKKFYKSQTKISEIQSKKFINKDYHNQIKKVYQNLLK